MNLLKKLLGSTNIKKKSPKKKENLQETSPPVKPSAHSNDIENIDSLESRDESAEKDTRAVTIEKINADSHEYTDESVAEDTGAVMIEKIDADSHEYTDESVEEDTGAVTIEKINAE